MMYAFADDIVLIEKSSAEIKEKLEIWRKVLEAFYFHLNSTKTVPTRCGPSG